MKQFRLPCGIRSTTRKRGGTGIEFHFSGLTASKRLLLKGAPALALRQISPKFRGRISFKHVLRETRCSG